MGRFDGKVALITGGARGQGRSHALNFAREGADVILLDLCRQQPEVEHSMSTPEDLAETKRLVEKEGQRAVTFETDVRDHAAVQASVESGVREFGRLDFVSANAGVMATTGEPSTRIDAWQIGLDTMLSGVFYTLQAAMDPMIAGGRGGSIVITSSMAGLRGIAFDLHMLNPGEMGYSSAKTGVIGLMRNFAMALGQHKIRVNSLHPMGVRTPMITNEFFSHIRDSAPPGWMVNSLGIDLIEPQDVSNAVMWLCSEESRYVTGSMISIDAGTMLN